MFSVVKIENDKLSLTEIIIYTLIFIISAGMIIWGLNVGMKKTEISECLKWQKEATMYQGYYLTEWQKQQCDHYKITINAPVKYE